MRLDLIFGVCFLSICIINALENPVIEYCTVKHRSSLHGCTLIRVSNSTFEFGQTDQSVAKLQNKDTDRFAFFQCTAAFPIRWLAKKPSKAIKLLINNETNRFNQDPLSTSPPKHTQQLFIDLWEDYSTILRCQSFSNPNVAADVFLELHYYRRPFWSSVPETSLYIALNGSQKSFIFPCVAKEFYGNYSLVFARKESRKVVFAEVSPDCAECICRASSNCGHFPCISSRVCGDIPTTWTSADETDHGLTEEFAECTKSFPCARRMVENYLDGLKGRFTDCNGDGLRTCEDYARVHLLGGAEQCHRNLSTTEQRQLNLFQQCLVGKSQNFTILSHGIGNYDRRIGLKVNEPPSFTSQYECQSLTEEYIRGLLVLPLDAEQIVSAILYYDYEDDQVYCRPTDPIVRDPLVIFGRCSSLAECELTFKAIPPSVIPAISLLNENQYETFNTDNVPRRTPDKGYKNNFTHAYIQCFGRFTFTFVNEVDYLFTGLDGKKYFISDGFPSSSIINLENKNERNLSAFVSYSFKCTISTFVLLPNIQFVVHYGSGARMLGELPSGTKVQIVDENIEKAVMTSELLLMVTTNMTKITCFAPKITSRDWAHAEVNLFIVINETPPPVIELCASLPPSATVPCHPGKVSSSAFEFGKIDQNVVKYFRKWRGEFAYLKCKASYPIRWLARKPLGSISLLASNETNRFDQDPMNTSRTEFSEILSVELRDSYSKILRCESYADSNLAAEVFLNFNDRGLPFPDQGSHLFLVDGAGKSFIVPCGSSEFHGNYEITFARKESRKRSLGRMSEECAECICSASSHCLTFPCNSYEVCGEIPRNYRGTLQPEDSGGYAQYTDANCSNIVCASKFLHDYLDKIREDLMDCDGDGMRTCEDYARAHLLRSADHCSSKTTRENILATTFPQCLAQIGDNFTILSRGRSDYDPRIGLKVNETPIFSSLYECHSFTQYEFTTRSMYPLNIDKKVKSNLFYDRKTEKIRCEPADNKLSRPEIFFRQCDSVPKCELMYKPLLPAVLPEFVGLRSYWYEGISPKSNESAFEGYSTGYNHSYVHCFGGSNHGFTSEVDYLFTGLDGTKYLFSLGYPLPSILRLRRKNNETMISAKSYSFDCTISTFVLLPNIQFVVHFATQRNILVKVGNEPSWAQIRQHPNSEGNATLTSQILLTVASDMVKITCYAPKVNSKDWAYAEENVRIVTQNPSTEEVIQGNTTILVLGCLAAFGSFIAVAVYVMRKKNVTSKGKENFELDSIEHNVEETVQEPSCLAEKPILMSDLKIEDVVLGEGHFGIVRQGLLLTKQVAVKSCKPNIDREYLTAFLKELKILSCVGKHENVVEYLGAVIESMQENDCLAVFELSHIGNLNKYLRGMVRKGEEHLVTQSVLTCFCRQIANGMEFLSSKEIIHGDLAARNVLVFENNIVKVTDFGMSRKLYNYSIYKKQRKVALPWRWMALESLRYLEFSKESDVWSLGVTMWEIFSLAKVPFPFHTLSDEFTNSIESGYRLAKPDLAPDAVYEMMTSCWKNNAEDRPTFSELKQLLVNIERDVHVSDGIYGMVMPMEDSSNGQ